MQIIIVVQVQLPFIGEFDLPTKPLPLVLDFDQFSDVMYNATSVSLVRVLIPVKSHRAEDAMATPKMCCQKDTNLKQRGKSTFHQVKNGNILGNTFGVFQTDFEQGVIDRTNAWFVGFNKLDFLGQLKYYCKYGLAYLDQLLNTLDARLPIR